jgi:RNA polymerase sigma-70 factor (ECF subfamily)
MTCALNTGVIQTCLPSVREGMLARDIKIDRGRRDTPFLVSGDSMRHPEGSIGNLPSAEIFNDLVVRVGMHRDRSAFRLVFEHFAPRIRAYLLGRLGSGSAVDDVVQDVMLTLWNKAAVFDPKKASASSWVFTIARNRMIDHIRQGSTKARYEADSMREIPPDAPQADELMMRNEDVVRVSEALRGLPQEQAEILELSYRAGLTHQEISVQLSVPLGTIKSRIRLAMKKLKTRLGEQS